MIKISKNNKVIKEYKTTAGFDNWAQKQTNDLGAGPEIRGCLRIFGSVETGSQEHPWNQALKFQEVQDVNQ